MDKAFFIDKDGTLVDNSLYPTVIPSDDLLEKDVVQGLQYLQANGFKLIIISNQSWVAKGRLSHEEVENIFLRLRNRLAKHNIHITQHYFCPHQKGDNCSCRKPLIHNILAAAAKYNLDLSRSYMMGDMEEDVLAGKNAGLTTVLVQTGCGRQYASLTRPDFVIENVNAVWKVV
jgi:histidinol-phosphate phosphatase family protein